MRTALRFLIRLYQLCLSPFLGVHCRFTPTCSCYAAQAVELHGPVKGSWLATKRVLRCHPWTEATCDPVPEPKHSPARHA